MWERMWEGMLMRWAPTKEIRAKEVMGKFAPWAWVSTLGDLKDVLSISPSSTSDAQW